MLSRVIWGAQTAILVVIVAVILSIFIGVALGLYSGYFGGWLDRCSSSSSTRSTPSRRCCSRSCCRSSSRAASRASGAASLPRRGSIVVVFIPQYFRVIRAETVRIKAEPFVESAKVLGASNYANRVQARLPQRDAHAAAHHHAELRGGDPDPGGPRLPRLRHRADGRRRVGLRPEQGAVGRHERHLVDRAVPRPRDRAGGARHHARGREPQRPRRPSPSRPPAGRAGGRARSPRPRSYPAARWRLAPADSAVSKTENHSTSTGSGSSDEHGGRHQEPRRLVRDGCRRRQGRRRRLALGRPRRGARDRRRVGQRQDGHGEDDPRPPARDRHHPRRRGPLEPRGRLATAMSSACRSSGSATSAAPTSRWCSRSRRRR